MFFLILTLAVLEFTFFGTDVTANLGIVIKVAVHVFLYLLGSNVCEKFYMDQIVNI